MENGQSHNFFEKATKVWGNESLEKKTINQFHKFLK